MDEPATVGEDELVLENTYATFTHEVRDGAPIIRVTVGPDDKGRWFTVSRRDYARLANFMLEGLWRDLDREGTTE